ncbi:DUF2787 family protein [Psychromonas sp. MME2]|uniref:DUF2787 family protein n=1 Tax=unclassified Psychromonas TaxID=2614957 RepID=UPI00339BA019
MDIKLKQGVFYRCSKLFIDLGRFLKECVIKICHKLFAVLRKAIKQTVKDDILQFIFNYLDSPYLRESDSYDSVVLSKAKGTFNGIEFNRDGDSYAGMVGEFDFDFSSETPFVPYSQLSLIIAHIKAIFKLWVNDFYNFLKYGVFYPIKLNAW